MRCPIDTKRTKAFTLIELLVVISVIALLLSVLMPALQAARRKAREVVCTSNLHQLGVAALAYEQNNGRLPLHYTENPGGSAPLPCWPEQLASNYNEIDVRDLWEPYLGTLNFLNCPLLPELDITLAHVPLKSRRVYGGYTFVFGYFRDRSATGSWGPETSRWTKTSRTWNYQGRRISVLAGDRLYRSIPLMAYRVNHGQGVKGLSKSFHDYEDSTSTSDAFVHSLYNGPILDINEDLREKTTASYVFKDGSARKYSGDDEVLYDLYDPSNQSSRTGSQLVPLR